MMTAYAVHMNVVVRIAGILPVHLFNLVQYQILPIFRCENAP